MSTTLVLTANSGFSEGVECQSGPLVATASDGTIWVAVWESLDEWHFYYSTDGGTTFTENTNLGLQGWIGGTYGLVGALMIDDQDHMWFVGHVGNSQARVERTTSAITTTATGWDLSKTLVTTDGNLRDMDACVVKNTTTATTYYTLAIASRSATGQRTVLNSHRFLDDGTFVDSGVWTIESTTGTLGGVAVDWTHNGDGMTPSGDPYVFVAYSDGSSNVDVVRMAESFTTGIYDDPGTITTLTTDAEAGANKGSVVGRSDGARFIVSVPGDSVGSDELLWFERDYADTTTTERTVPTINNGVILANALGVAGLTGNVRAFYVSETDDDVKYMEYYRSSDTWSSPVTIFDGTNINMRTLTVQRGYASTTLHGTFIEIDPNPDEQYHFSVTTNQTPNAPTLVSPVAGVDVDRDATITLDWTFSDPDPGDTQSEFDLRYRIVGAGTWTDVNSVTTTTSYDITASTLTADSTYEWEVRTYDSTGTVGPWSGVETFVPRSAPPAPTITAPTLDQVLAESTFVVEWSAPNQDAYQLRRVADSAGSPDTGTVYEDTGTVASSGARSRTVEFDTNLRTEHVQVRVRRYGLWSAWGTQRYDISFTPPPTSTASVAAYPATQALEISVSVDTPTGGQPTPTVFDVFVRVAAGGTADLDRPVGGNGIRIAKDIPVASTYVDHRVVGGYDYEYRVKVYGDNNTSIFSAWV